MTTYTSEPGTRLGGRYRLEDRIAAGSGWDAWKAIDETLARAVTVFTLAQAFPRIPDVVTAARAASRLTDTRLAQVFDVEDSWEQAYIVMEWAAGETLGDLVASGPIEPARGARIIAEAAAALSSAHAAGLAHMCLSPGSVRWSQTGEVKVVGLGIDAALSGTSSPDPVIADTRGLGKLLYAALTGYWPGSEYSSLPAAPLAGSEPCSPRQVVAGIPLEFSGLACRALQLQSPEGNPPVTTPGEFAEALVAVLPPDPVPMAPPPPARRERYSGQAADSSDDPYWPGRERPGAGRGGYDGYDSDGRRQIDQGLPATDWSSYGDATANDGGADGFRSAGRGHRADPSAYEHTGRSIRPGRGGATGRRRRGQRGLPVLGATKVPIGLVATAGALVLVGLVAAVMFWPGGSTARQPGAGGKHPGTKGSSASVVPLVPVNATGFDPLTSAKNDRGNENSQLAKYAIDGSPQTYWASQWYRTPDFGRLKAGSGLMIEMAKAVTFRSVVVTFSSTLPGADVKLLVGNSATRSAANLNSMTPIASANGVSGTVTFRISSSVPGRYLVIWFTRLPQKPGSGHLYMGEVFNVAIRGIA